MTEPQAKSRARPPRRHVAFRISPAADEFITAIAAECEAERSVVIRAMLAQASAQRDSVVVRVKREMETR